MARLAECLRYYVTDRLNNHPGWQDLKVRRLPYIEDMYAWRFTPIDLCLELTTSFAYSVETLGLTIGFELLKGVIYRPVISRHFS